jgi:hypothetical protein
MPCTVIGERAFPHGGAGLGALSDWLLTATAGPAGTIVGAIEVPHGPMVETLLEHGFILNPAVGFFSG